MIAEAFLSPQMEQIVLSAGLFLLAAAAVLTGWAPVRDYIRRQEIVYENVLQHKLLLTIAPRVLTIVSFVMMAMLAFMLYQISGSVLGAAMGVAGGVLLPRAVLNLLHKRHLDRLESQLVMGIQTLASGVRAGLNLVQSMQLVARDGPPPLRHEFNHMLREYEYGVPLDDAMSNAAVRIGSGNYRLLFSALQTHRERGGDLGETLDRIGSSIREIQRLEDRVKTLTAEGRATARWLGAMPGVVMVIIYTFVDESGVKALFSDDIGKLILLGVVALNVIGFLMIRKIVAVEI